MTTMSPNWSETTVRWLRTNYPLLTPASSSKTFQVLLNLALVRAKYFRHEMIDKRGFAEKKYLSSLEQTANDWNKAKHDHLVKFLTTGGYEGLKEREAAKSMKDVVTLATMGADGKIEEVETIGLDDYEEKVESLVLPRSQLSPAHELEEIVQDAVLATDPRFGVW